MHGWANRILRIDLSNRRMGVQEAEPYVPEYLGGRGIAARRVSHNPLGAVLGCP